MGVLCGECGSLTKLVGGEAVYPHRQDLFHLKFWHCTCGAYVGTHAGSEKPLGVPAGAETRRLRSTLHVEFDPLWKTGGMRRSDAYRLLSEALKLPFHETHIAMFDAKTCLRALVCVSEFKNQTR